MRSPDFGIVAGLAILVLLCASLPYMSISRGVVLTVAFQKVDAAPHAKAAAQGDDQGLQYINSTVEENEKSPNSFLSGLSHSIINQFRFHNFLCLCLASVHLPHPFHLVFGFQLLGHAVLLYQ